MANGFFLGGAAQGINTAEDNARQQERVGLEGRSLDLRTQALQFEQQQKLLATADQHVADTMSIVANTVQQGKLAGRDPQSILKAVQPLVQDAGSILQKTGRDPSVLQNKVLALIAQPSPTELATGAGRAEAAKAAAMEPNDYKFQQIGESATGEKQYGFVSARKKSVIPANPPAAKTSSAGPTSDQPEQSTLPEETKAVEAGAAPRNYDFYKNLPDEIKPTIQQMVDYEIKPQDLSIKNNQRQKMMALAKLYDPEYDSMLAPARQKAINEFVSGGQTSPASIIMNGGTAIQHANELGKAIDSYMAIPGVLNRIAQSGKPVISYIAGRLRDATVKGTPEGEQLTRIMTGVQHFSEEVTRFYSGSVGSEAERERAIKNLDTAKSLTELRGGIDEEAKYIGDRVNNLQSRIKNAIGPRGWMAAMKKAGADFPVINEQSQRALDEIKGRPASGATTRPAAVSSPVAPAAPAESGVVDFRDYFGKQ